MSKSFEQRPTAKGSQGSYDQLSPDVLLCVLRARVMDELARDGIRVALPLAHENVDMFVLAECASSLGVVQAIPIKVVSFSIDALGEHIASLRPQGLLVIVGWERCASDQICTFALTAAELTVLRMMHLICRPSKGSPGSNHVEPALRQYLDTYRVSAGMWRKQLEAVLNDPKG